MAFKEVPRSSATCCWVRWSLLRKYLNSSLSIRNLGSHALFFCEKSGFEGSQFVIYHHVVWLSIVKGALALVGLWLISDQSQKKMASLPNAKFSREKPFLVRRYNYRYGVYNGRMDPITPDQSMSRKKCHNVAKKFEPKNSSNWILFRNNDQMSCRL